MKKFDNVPNNLRSAKLIQYVTNNFVIKEKIDNYYIAIKQHPGVDERNFVGWIKIFGNAIDVNKLYTPSRHQCPKTSIDLFDSISTKNSKSIQFGSYQFDIIYNNSLKRDGHHLCMPLNDLWFYSGNNSLITPFLK